MTSITTPKIASTHTPRAITITMKATHNSAAAARIT